LNITEIGPFSSVLTYIVNFNVLRMKK